MLTMSSVEQDNYHSCVRVGSLIIWKLHDLSKKLKGPHVAQATIKWLEEKRFVGIDSTDHGIVVAGTKEDGKIGVKPSDLLLLALGS